MKQLMITLVMIFTLLATSMYANPYSISSEDALLASQNATITFRNTSDYTLTLKICNSYGGVYRVVELGSKSSQIVSFGKTATYDLKIKATKLGQSTYHKGGSFSIMCNEYEWSEGEMVFQMSSYGSGLGPSISRYEFESDR